MYFARTQKLCHCIVIKDWFEVFYKKILRIYRESTSVYTISSGVSRIRLIISHETKQGSSQDLTVR